MKKRYAAFILALIISFTAFTCVADASGNGNAATVACIGGLCLVMSFSSLVG